MRPKRVWCSGWSLALGLAYAAVARPGAINGAEPVMLDLSRFQSEKFVSDGKTNTYWETLAGRQVFDGLPFQVEGRGCVYGSRMGPEKRDGTNTYPDHIGIPVERKFDELDLLHVTQFADLEGEEIAIIRLNYADGSTQEFPIRFGGHVRDWHRMPSEEKELLTDPNTRIVWRGSGVERIHSTLRLFKTTLANPYPDKVVTTMDVVSKKHLAAYDLIAATVANRDPGRAVTPSPPPEGGERKFEGTLTVRVTERGTGQPVAAALVDPILKVDEVNVIGIPFLTSSNGEGVVRYPAGRTARIEVVVEKDGLATQKGALKLGKSVSRRLAIKMGPVAKVTGIVQDSTGTRLDGVELAVWPDGRASSKGATTDTAGQFTLTWDPNARDNADYGAWLIARDVKRNLAVVQLLDESTTNLDLHVEPGLVLAGRATDSKGKPLTNATAGLTFWTDRMGASLGKPVAADAKGRFEIKALPTGHRYGVSVGAKGYGRVSRNVSEDAEGTRIELEACELAVADQSVSGVVLDADDKPVANASVYGYGDGQPGISGKTNKKGHFTLDKVCAGPIQLQANTSTGEYGHVAVEAGQTNVTIQLGVRETYDSSSGPVKIGGQVLDPEGKAVAKATVHLFIGYSENQKQTDNDGRFRMTFNPRQSGGMGDSQPIVVARDVSRNLAAAIELEEGVSNATVHLKPGLIMAGRVTDPNGKAVTNARAQAFFSMERRASSLGMPVRVDAQGRFEISALPRGRPYMVNASARGYGQDQRNIDAANTDTNRLVLENFELTPANQRVAGVVLNDDDKPVSRAHIYCYGGKQPNISTQTDAKGRFSLDKVCPGQIQISANSQGGGYANVVAEAGDTNVVIRLSNSRTVMRSEVPAVRLKGKPLPDLRALGITSAQAPADQALLAVLIDAEQRPSRHALRVVTEQAASSKEKGVAVVVIQAGAMADDAFARWKQETASPFPVGCLKGNAEKERRKWGANALPWLILTDKSHTVTAEGFNLDELEAKLQDLGK